MSQAIPVTLLGGFLGAGKTTLLNHLLSSMAGRRVAVLVNDFGAINIDASLVRRHQGETLELTNGCICCSLGNNLLLTLIDLLNRPDPPEQLLIEASGVADPAKLAQLALADPGLSLDAVLVMVDGAAIQQQVDDPYVGETVRRQLAAADLLILNKRDLLGADALSALKDWLAGVVPGVPVVKAEYAEVPVAVLLGLAGAGTRAESLAGTVAHPDYTTLVLDDPRGVDEASLETLLETLPGAVLRVKGVMRSTTERRLVVQRVGRRLACHDAGPWSAGERSRLVLIGLASQVDLSAWEARLAALLVG